MKRKFILLPILSIILTGCELNFGSFNTGSSNGTSTSSETSSELLQSSEVASETLSSSSESSSSIPIDEEPALVSSPEYYEFWDENTKLDFTVEMDPIHLKNMSEAGANKNDPRNELYFPANLTIKMNEKSYYYEEVGLRSKGNLSRVNFAPEGEIVEGFNFKIAFDHTWTAEQYEPYGLRKTWTKTDPDYIVRNDRRFLDMKKMDFKFNRSGDTSMINQAFINRLFAAKGLITPHSTMTEFKINNDVKNTHLGVVFINEVIDKTLIRRYFNNVNDEGDLYKCLWPTNLLLSDTLNDLGAGVYTVKPEMIGVEDTFNWYHPTYDLKTNEKTSQHEALINLIKTLDQSKKLTDTALKQAIENVVDIDSFLRFAALSYLVGNPDDMRNNVNNVYIYFHPVTGKAYFITYDNDWSLGLVWSEGNSVEWGLGVADLLPRDTRTALNGTVSNPLYYYTIMNQGGYDDGINRHEDFRVAYDQYVQEYVDSEAFSVATYQALFNDYEANYGDVTSTVFTATGFISTSLFEQWHARISATVENAYK